MAPDLVEELSDAADGLRVVATLGGASWEIEYIRESLRDEYDDGDFERAYHSLMANQVSSEDFGDVGDFGEFACEVYFFEEVVVFQFPAARYRGVFASYDWHETFPVTDVVALADVVAGEI